MKLGTACGMMSRIHAGNAIEPLSKTCSTASVYFALLCRLPVRADLAVARVSASFDRATAQYDVKCRKPCHFRHSAAKIFSLLSNR